MIWKPSEQIGLTNYRGLPSWARNLQRDRLTSAVKGPQVRDAHSLPLPWVLIGGDHGQDRHTLALMLLELKSKAGGGGICPASQSPDHLLYPVWVSHLTSECQLLWQEVTTSWKKYFTSLQKWSAQKSTPPWSMSPGAPWSYGDITHRVKG